MIIFSNNHSYTKEVHLRNNKFNYSFGRELFFLYISNKRIPKS